MPKFLNFFPKTKFFINQKKPDPTKNFFENYSDHLNFLIRKFDMKFNYLMSMDNTAAAFNYISKEALKRLSLFEQLRDGYDYFDEIMGTTTIPALGLIGSIASLGMALWESVQALVIKIRIIRTDHEDHLGNATGYLLLSAASFLVGMASFLKSALSLVTRPIVTALHGFAEQDEDRFYNEDSIVGRMIFG